MPRNGLPCQLLTRMNAMLSPEMKDVIINLNGIGDNAGVKKACGAFGTEGFFTMMINEHFSLGLGMLYLGL